MIKFKKVETKEEANQCYQLLLLLAENDRKYDSNIKEDFKIFNFYDTYYKDETYCLILALDSEKPVGFINGYLKEKAGIFTIENTGLITSLYVKSEYHNGGIATRLLDEFYNWCRKMKIKKIDISVYTENETAKKLYMKQGFETTILRMTKNLE